MATSIRTLLDGVHTAAWRLTQQPSSSPEAQLEPARLLNEWRSLAAATTRALDRVPADRWGQQQVASVRSILLQLTTLNRPEPGEPASQPDLADMAVRLGAIADLLVGVPRADNERDRLAALGLQASILAPVHLAAHHTLTVADQQPGISTEARWLLRQLAGLTEVHAATPVQDRASRYEDLTVPGLDEASLDAAVHRWSRDTQDALGSVLTVTSAALQTTAADLVVLTAAAAHTTWAAIKLGHLDRQHGHATIDALRDANTAWRAAAVWPDQLRLDGERTPSNAQASHDLRRALNDVLREGTDWARPERVAERTDLPRLLGTMRHALHLGEQAAIRHHLMIRYFVLGKNRLWISAAALPDRDRLTPDQLEARLRHGWIQRPLEEPTGLMLLENAVRAREGTTHGLQTLEASTEGDLTGRMSSWAHFDGHRVCTGRQALESAAPAAGPARIRPLEPWPGQLPSSQLGHRTAIGR